MTSKEAKEYLSAAYYTAKRIESKQEQINNLRSMATKATGTMTAERVSGTQDRSRVETCVIKIVDLEKEIQKEIDVLSAQVSNARKIIDKLPDEKQKAILEDYHVHQMRIWQIARKYNYSDRQIINILNRAYSEIERLH